MLRRGHVSLAKFSADVKVLVLSMNPQGGALGPALRRLGFHPYTLEDTYRYGHMASHPKEWVSVLRKEKRFDLMLLQPTSTATGAETKAMKGAGGVPVVPYDSLVGPPATLAFESILAECPLSTRVVLVEEPDKLAWEKEAEMVLKGFLEQSAKGARRPIGQDFHEMVKCMIDLRKATHRGAQQRFGAAGGSHLMPQLPLSTMLDLFEGHVRDVVPRDRLLVYRLGDGWGPLCAFLGVPVPTDAVSGGAVSFPKAETGLETFANLSGKLRLVDVAVALFMLVVLSFAVVVLTPLRDSLTDLVVSYKSYTEQRLENIRARLGRKESVTLRETLIEAKKATMDFEEKERDKAQVSGFLKNVLLK